MQVALADQVDVAGFHGEASRLLAHQVPPETVRWSAAPAQTVEEEELDLHRASIHNGAARAIVPQSFIRISELVVLHRDAHRFDLLYRTLWRLVHEPELKHDSADQDLARLRQMAQAVRRDMHKMKTRLAFRPLLVGGQRVQVAWYEPTHHVCEAVAGWLARQEPDAHWLLLTPDRSMRWDGQRLLSAPGVAPLRAFPGGDPPDDALAEVVAALPWLQASGR